ncbi:hypothetical protein [Streptomyces sp. SAS_260]|uniref:hypothetical protein n=1 Tax=Streptomyces sp. SAS_260 TaxID=3412751 RepID=UPI00403CE0B6
MNYVQITLALAELACAWAAFWQVRGFRDPLLIPLIVVVAAAGVGLPLLYPLGHSTISSLALQVIALIALILIAAVGRSRKEADDRTRAG